MYNAPYSCLTQLHYVKTFIKCSVMRTAIVSHHLNMLHLAQVKQCGALVVAYLCAA